MATEPHEHQWNWIDVDAQRCIRCGLTAEAHIAALEAELDEARVVRDAAYDEIMARSGYLNIAGKEIDTLKAENAQLRDRLRAIDAASERREGE